jgi:hypothetical protein
MATKNNDFVNIGNDPNYKNLPVYVMPPRPTFWEKLTTKRTKKNKNKKVKSPPLNSYNIKNFIQHSKNNTRAAYKEAEQMKQKIKNTIRNLQLNVNRNRPKHLPTPTSEINFQSKGIFSGLINPIKPINTISSLNNKQQIDMKILLEKHPGDNRNLSIAELETLQNEIKAQIIKVTNSHKQFRNLNIRTKQQQNNKAILGENTTDLNTASNIIKKRQEKIKNEFKKLKLLLTRITHKIQTKKASLRQRRGKFQSSQKYRVRVVSSKKVHGKSRKKRKSKMKSKKNRRTKKNRK